MARNKLSVKLKDKSFKIISITFALIVIMLGLTAAGVFNVSSYVIPLIKLSAVIILFLEIGILAFLKSAVKSKGKTLNFLTSVEIIVGVLVALEMVLSLLNVSVETLSVMSGWVLFIFGIAFLIETFAR